jgi:hypothetical protein
MAALFEYTFGQSHCMFAGNIAHTRPSQGNEQWVVEYGSDRVNVRISNKNIDG